MQINNITIPDESVTKEYITDPIGETMYIVLTNISVQPLSLSDFQAKVDEANQQVALAQATADELQAKATEFNQAIQTIPAQQETPQ